MKNLIMIVHANFQQDLADSLRSLDVVESFTFTHIECHEPHRHEYDRSLSAREKVVGYTPRVRIDVFLQESDVPTVLNEIRKRTNSDEGLGVYWVTTVEEHGQL